MFDMQLWVFILLGHLQGPAYWCDGWFFTHPRTQGYMYSYGRSHQVSEWWFSDHNNQNAICTSSTFTVLEMSTSHVCTKNIQISWCKYINVCFSAIASNSNFIITFKEKQIWRIKNFANILFWDPHKGTLTIFSAGKTFFWMVYGSAN